MAKKAKKFSWMRFVSSDIYIDESLASNLDAVFYRYSSFPELVDLVSNRTMSFAHPSKWPDKYEHHALETGFGDNGPFRKLQPFAKCFSSAFSSEALWRLYRTSGPVFRYGFSLETLLDWLRVSDVSAAGKMFVGMVDYLPSPKIRVTRTQLNQKPVSQAAAQWLLTKRSGFDYEKELRVIFLRKGGAISPGIVSATSGIPFSLRRILVDPYLPDWEFRHYASVISKLSPGCRVEKSKFDKQPE